MALTFSPVQQHSDGDLRGASTIVTFDSSYVTGGEALTPQQLALGQIVGPIDFEHGEDGYVFKWDSVTEKLLVFQESVVPILVNEEVVTVTADVGTLAHLPAYIVAITDTTSGAVYRIIPVAETPVDNVSVTVNFLTGVITAAAADDPATLTVTYFPQQGSGVFAKANLVIDETYVSSDSKTNLANRAAVIQYVYNTTNTAVVVEVPPAEAPTATNEQSLKINDSGNTSFDGLVGDNADVMTVTYLKFAGLASPTQFIDDGDLTLASEVQDWGLAAGQNFQKMVIPGYGTRFVGESAGANESGNWSNRGDTAANLIGVMDLLKNVYTTANTAAILTLSQSWLVIDPVFDRPSRQLSEVPNGTDLSAVVVEVYARGR